MAKRDPKLTKVKDHTYKFPLPGIATRPAKAQVMINVETGSFSIALPKEIVDLLKLGESGSTCSSREMNEVERQFDRVVDRYSAIVRSQNREKVIVVNYKRNWPGRAADGGVHTWSTGSGDELGGGAFSRNDVPNLGMALSYEVLWRLNGKDIFEIHFNDDGSPAGDPDYRYRGDEKGRIVIPWTAEREEFFGAMREGLGNMIERMNQFFAADMLANIDRAIAFGGAGLSITTQAALPAPTEGSDQW